MQTITENEARKRLTALLDSIEQGEEVTITRMGRPVARLVPVGQVGKTPDDPEHRALRAEAHKMLAESHQNSIRNAAEELRTLGGELRLDGLTIRDLIHDGRR